MPLSIILANHDALYISGGNSGYYFLYKLALTLPKLQIESPSFEAGKGFHLTIETSLASKVQIEGTTDLVHWSPLLEEDVSPPETEAMVPLLENWRYLRVRTN
jgi:hypothetical protein